MCTSSAFVGPSGAGFVIVVLLDVARSLKVGPHRSVTLGLRVQPHGLSAPGAPDVHEPAHRGTLIVISAPFSRTARATFTAKARRPGERASRASPVRLRTANSSGWCLALDRHEAEQ